MRNAAIPICYFNDKKLALDLAKKQSLITHQGYEAAGCCQLLTLIIIKIIESKLKEYNRNKSRTVIHNTPNILNQENLNDILDNLEGFRCDFAPSVNLLAQSKQEGNDKNRNWNWKENNFQYSEIRAKKQPSYIGSYCMDCLSMALHILYKINSFKEAILKAVNLCGDADSIGSVVGQIAGAYYGLDSIPKDWINTINQWDQNEIALRGYILCQEAIYNNSTFKRLTSYNY